MTVTEIRRESMRVCVRVCMCMYVCMCACMSFSCLYAYVYPYWYLLDDECGQKILLKNYKNQINFPGKCEYIHRDSYFYPYVLVRFRHKLVYSVPRRMQFM